MFSSKFLNLNKEKIIRVNSFHTPFFRLFSRSCSLFNNLPINAFTLQNNKLKHRYYAVGASIEELRSDWLLRIKPREISRSELEKSLFMHQSPVKLFLLYDHAKEYAQNLRCKANAFSLFPKMPLNKSKIWPIFTLELTLTASQYKIETETLLYIDRYADGKSYSSTEKKQATVNFYSIHISEISKDSIVRAEFYKSVLQPIELLANSKEHLPRNQ